MLIPPPAQQAWNQTHKGKQGLYRDIIRIMEKKMVTIGIIILHIWVFYRDNGKNMETTI